MKINVASRNIRICCVQKNLVTAPNTPLPDLIEQEKLQAKRA
jgi:hypothetical protein